tara:strand:+ start:3105 stop:3239 length:135 start_codon:yes stop_codon:yes gene_type:complete
MQKWGKKMDKKKEEVFKRSLHLLEKIKQTQKEVEKFISTIDKKI